MSRLGKPTTVKIAGRRYEIPPEEIPGEVEWRADLIAWLVQKTSRELLSLPVSEHMKRLVDKARLHMLHMGLQEVEAFYVLKGARFCFEDLSTVEQEWLLNTKANSDAEMAHEADRLLMRFEHLVLRYGRLLDCQTGVVDDRSR